MSRRSGRQEADLKYDFLLTFPAARSRATV